MRSVWTIALVATGVAVSASFCNVVIAAAEEDSRLRDEAPCVNHPDLDVTAYEAVMAEQLKHYVDPDPIQRFVPKDVIIENGAAAFTTITKPGRFNRGSVPEYVIPIRDADDAPLTDDSDKWQGNTYWPNGETLISPCRVRDPSGKRWLVMRSEGGILGYYNFDRFMPAPK